MKKSLILVVTLLLTLLAGCTTDKTLPSLRVGLLKEDSPPMIVWDDRKSEASGFDVDFANKVAAKLGYNPIYVPVTAADIETMLKDGTIDIMIGAVLRDNLPNSSEIMQTRKYFDSSLVILYNSKDEYKTIDDLKETRVGVVAFSTAYYRYGFDSEFREEIESWTSYSSKNDMFYDLENDKIDAVICDESLAVYMTNKNESMKRSEPVSEMSLCIAVRNNDAELKSNIDSAIGKVDEEWKTEDKAYSYIYPNGRAG